MRLMAEEQDSLTEWSTQVKRRAISLLKETNDRNVARILANEMNQFMEAWPYGLPATEAQVARWLSGEAAPRDTLYYRAMMQALDLPLDTDAEMLTTVKQCHASGHTLTIFRKSLDALYEQIPDHLKSDDLLTAISLGNRGGDDKRTQGRIGLGKNPAARRAEMDEDALLEILATTEEPGDFILAVRKQKGWSQDAFGIAMDHPGQINKHGMVSAYEGNINIPSAEMLPYLKNAIVAAGYGDKYPRFEEIVIHAWLKKTKKEIKANGHESGHIDWLPPSYWKGVLEQHHNPEAWEAYSPKPLWADSMMTIQSKADYLYAMQRALGLSNAETASATTMNEHNVATMHEPFTTHFRRTKVDSNTGRKLMDFYAKNDAVALATTLAEKDKNRLQPEDFPEPLFVREIYDALPDRRERREADGLDDTWVVVTERASSAGVGLGA